MKMKKLKLIISVIVLLSIVSCKSRSYLESTTVIKKIDSVKVSGASHAYEDLDIQDTILSYKGDTLNIKFNKEKKKFNIIHTRPPETKVTTTIETKSTFANIRVEKKQAKLDYKAKKDSLKNHLKELKVKEKRSFSSIIKTYGTYACMALLILAVIKFNKN